MRSKFSAKLLGSAAAIALAAGTVLATAGPASAAPWGWRGGWGWGPGAIAGGIVGGALAAATSPLWAPGYYGYAPGYAYAPGYTYDYVAPTGGGSVGWCEAHYRSYNPATGTFLGYDGRYHPCP
jgi:hypothetical protein